MASIEKSTLIELVNAASNGSNEAQAELYKTYYKEMVRIALHNTSWNEPAAEDLVQDAFINAFKHLDSLSSPLAFPKYLSRCVVNRCRDYLKSSAKKTNVNFSALDNQEDDIEYDPADEKIGSIPEESYSLAERDQIVRDILDKLNEDQKIVTIMYFYDNMSLNEIAEELGIPQSTVIGRVQTAKKNIKSAVTEMQQKHDIKLYTLAPLPFFMTMLGNASMETAHSNYVSVSGLDTASKEPKSGTNTQHQEYASADEKTDVYEKPEGDTGIGDDAETANKPMHESVQKSKNSMNHSSVQKTPDAEKIVSASASGSSSVSIATKIIAGVAAVAVAAGGGIYVGHHLGSNENPAPSSVVEETQAPATEAPQEVINEDKNDEIKESVDTSQASIKTIEAVPRKIEIDIPETWDFEVSKIDSFQSYIYPDPSDKNKYIKINSNNPLGGIGGEGVDTSEISYGNLNFDVYGSMNDNPWFLHMHSNKSVSMGQNPNDWYEYIVETNGIDVDSESFKNAMSSIKYKNMCQVSITADKLNVRWDSSASSQSVGFALKGEVYDVYREMATAEYRWYQIYKDNRWYWICYQKDNDVYAETIPTEF